MKVIFYPYSNAANKYLENQQAAVTSLGHQAVSIKNLLRDEISGDVIILNWYENVTEKTPLRTLKTYIFKIIGLFRLKGKIKIITIYNNKAPHDVHGLNLILSQLLQKQLFNISDSIVIMSEYARPYVYECINKYAYRKVSVVPHPNYIKPNSEDLLNKEKGELFVILYTGLIRPYKNVDMIINIASELTDIPVIFKICGKCPDMNYAEKLKQISKNLPNVEFNPGYIPDDEMDALIKSADIQIFPYNIKSSIQSGSVIHAFSNGRTVICPNIPAVMDFNKELYYGYDYCSESEHAARLKEQILNAYNDWKNDYDNYAKKGQRLYEQVRDNNSIEKVAEAFGKIFDGGFYFGRTRSDLY